MIKFDIKNRWSGAVQFTAEINCSEDAPIGIKVGLAVKWAVEARANLTGAYLTGAKWSGLLIQKAPVQIFGLGYTVTILDQHMQIGCELHSLADWQAFDDRRIASMDGTRSSRSWRDHKDGLLSIARGAGRSFDPAIAAEAAE